MWWRQSGEDLVRGNNNQWHRVTESEKSANKIIGIFAGWLFCSGCLAFLLYEFTDAYGLEIEGEKFEFACELGEDQIVEIGPLRGLNGNALFLSLHYECDWEPHLKTFKFYRHTPLLTYVSYCVQILNDKAQVLHRKTFMHQDAGSGEYGPSKPRWKEETFPVSSFSDSYTLQIRPIFDRQSLARFDKNADDKRLTISLQIKLIACVAPNRREKVEPNDISVAQARALVHRVNGN